MQLKTILLAVVATAPFIAGSGYPPLQEPELLRIQKERLRKELAEQMARKRPAAPVPKKVEASKPTPVIPFPAPSAEPAKVGGVKGLAGKFGAPAPPPAKPPVAPKRPSFVPKTSDELLIQSAPPRLHVRPSIDVPQKPKELPKPSVPVQPDTSHFTKILYPNQVHGDALEKYNIKKMNGCTSAIKHIIPHAGTSLECPPIYDVELGFTLVASDSCPQAEVEKLIAEFDRDIDALAQPYSYPLLHGHPRYPALVQMAQSRQKSGAMYAHVEGQTELNKLRDFLKRLDELVVSKDQQLHKFDEVFAKYADSEDLQTQLKLMPYKMYGKGPRLPLPSQTIHGVVHDVQEFLSTPLYGETEIPKKAMGAYQRAYKRLLMSDYYDKAPESAAERQWLLRTKPFDAAVVARYGLYEGYLKSSQKTAEPIVEVPKRFQVEERNGCTDAIKDLAGEGNELLKHCPPIYNVYLGFEPKVDDPSQQKVLESLLKDIDRDDDALGHQYSYPLLHNGGKYSNYVEAAKKRWVQNKAYDPVLGQDSLNELRAFLKRLDGLIVGRDEKWRHFDEMLKKSHKRMEHFDHHLKLMPHYWFRNGFVKTPPGIPTPITPLLQGNEALLSSPLPPSGEFQKNVLDGFKLAEKRLTDDTYDKFEQGMKEGRISPEHYAWYQRLQVSDQAVVQRYNAYNDFRQAVTSPPKPKVGAPLSLVRAPSAPKPKTLQPPEPSGESEFQKRLRMAREKADMLAKQLG